MDQLQEELKVEKTAEVKLSDDEKGTESKKKVGEGKDNSMHETEMSITDISVKKERRRLFLSKESIKGIWRISTLM